MPHPIRQFGLLAATLCLLLGSTAAHATQEYWYLMTPTDDFDKPMGFYHVKTTTDADGVTTTTVSQRARVNLFFFKIKVDEDMTQVSDADGIRSISANIRRAGTVFEVDGERQGQQLNVRVTEDGDTETYNHTLANIEGSDLALMLPLDIAALQAKRSQRTATLIPELESLAEFSTQYKGKQRKRTPDGKREVHVLERNDSREDQELWLDDDGVVQVLIGKRRAIVMSDQATVEAWAADNP